MPETVLTPVVPVPVQGEATVPLASFIRPFQRHYFSGLPERPNYRARSYDFAGVPALMPLVRAFLDTCAATETDDYRYLFTLLGCELATNSIQHSLSGYPGGSYTLHVHRDREGLRLSCYDRGGLRTRNARLAPTSGGADLGAESGRGLAMIDALATDWGDNGNVEYRTVWLYLAYDLTNSAWNGPN
ncbi:ATP-binding protein [Nocardiopsis alkaliphila]|uniref:ATP-binding protein n=1 Tax=Nocardiopsis alkaliphila TaxID=225762 RepID=UPI000347BCA9|nr:ATP-binding protein [Nocardiopsis alkaliphila]